MSRHSPNLSMWDDLRFPAQGINPPGLISDPDVESSTGLLLFSPISTEIIAGVAQTPHGWKEGSILRPHVHWQKTSSAVGDVLWRLEYELVNNGDVAAMDYGTTLDVHSSVPTLPDNNTANEVLISAFGDVPTEGFRISCLMFWKLSRVGGDAADTYGADARLIEFDIHYESDAIGSEHEFRKQNS